jgi:hypothetical protein
MSTLGDYLVSLMVFPTASLKVQSLITHRGGFPRYLWDC